MDVVVGRKSYQPERIKLLHIGHIDTPQYNSKQQKPATRLQVTLEQKPGTPPTVVPIVVPLVTQ